MYINGSEAGACSLELVGLVRGKGDYFHEPLVIHQMTDSVTFELKRILDSSFN